LTEAALQNRKLQQNPIAVSTWFATLDRSKIGATE
jgi:hypothetical protein